MPSAKRSRRNAGFDAPRRVSGHGRMRPPLHKLTLAIAWVARPQDLGDDLPFHHLPKFVGRRVDAAPNEPMLAALYRRAPVVAVEEFFSCVQIFGKELALAKYCQKKWF
jgi:hypothetical protein